ncbi:GDSL-type esterase/lipase family protein [Blastococcus sp. SYSU D00820]
MSTARRLVLGLLALALATGLLAVPAAPAAAAPSEPLEPAGGQPILLLVDTSGSMAEDTPDGVAKIEAAKTALLNVVTGLPLETDIGLRTYPAGNGDCGTGYEDFAVARRQPATMSARIRALTAEGGTPTAEALEAAGDRLITQGFEDATIVVVSDGASTCGDPCPVARTLVQRGLSVTIHSVGFALAPDDPAVAELTCLSDATGGTYTNADDSDALTTKLAQLSAPAVRVELATEDQFNAESQSALTVRATVSNPTQQMVTDVRVDLRFDPAASAGAPTVLAPLQRLGNLAPGASREVSWTALTAAAATEGEFEYTVRAISTGARPAEESGAILLRDGLDLDVAGELFQDAEHVLVLGDSFSSGEGGGRYEQATGSCHRSAYQYAVQLFGSSKVTNLACSGAIIDNHTLTQEGRQENGEPIRPQQEQLGNQPVDLVFLTMGGNDVGFEDIIKNCLSDTACTGRVTCAPDAVPFLGDFDCTDQALAMPAFWTSQLGSLRGRLPGYYQQVLDDTGDAPVVVLPYVNVVPLDDRGFNACISGLPGASRDELNQIRWLQAELNRHIGNAVAEVRANDPDGSRLYYAGDVETALQPDHTICDEDPWVNPIAAVADLEIQELVHPDRDGYRAIAGALIRWSARTNPPTVQDSVARPATLPERVVGGVVDGVQNTWNGARDWVDDRIEDVRSIDFTMPLRPITLPVGRPLRVLGSGYLPGVEVQIGVASTMHTLAVVTADDEGRIDATVELPEGLAGGHHVYATGFSPDGGYQLQSQAVEVTGPPIWGALVVSVAGLLVAVGGFLLVRKAGRRRRRPAVVEA